MRVALFHNMVAPYRHALFEALARRVELTVYYSVLRTRDRKWSTAIPGTYASEVLNGWVLYALERPLIYCPQVIRRVFTGEPEAVIAVLTRSNAVDVLRLSRAARERGIPLLLWIGEIDTPEYNGELPAWFRAGFESYFRRAIAAASGFLYYSELTREWAGQRGANGPHMTGTQVLSPAPIDPRDVENSTGTVRVLYAGKLEQRKGVDLLLSAFAGLPAELRRCVELILAGDGPLFGEFEKAAEAGLPIRIAGHVDRQDLWQLYRDADLLVLPTRRDPWGFVTNEAMSMGTPVLTTTAAGSRDLAAEAGWVTSTEPAAFAASLEQAIRECRQPGRRRQAISAEAAYRPEACADAVAALVTAAGAQRIVAEPRP